MAGLLFWVAIIGTGIGVRIAVGGGVRRRKAKVKQDRKTLQQMGVLADGTLRTRYDKAKRHEGFAGGRGPIVGLTDARWEKLLTAWNSCCAYCGRGLAQGQTHKEHVIPLYRGGPNHAENVVPACDGCNLRKGVLTGDEYVKKRRKNREPVNPEWDHLRPQLAVKPSAGPSLLKPFEGASVEDLRAALRASRKVRDRARHRASNKSRFGNKYQAKAAWASVKRLGEVQAEIERAIEQTKEERRRAKGITPESRQATMDRIAALLIGVGVGMAGIHLYMSSVLDRDPLGIPVFFHIGVGLVIAGWITHRSAPIPRGDSEEPRPAQKVSRTAIPAIPRPKARPEPEPHPAHDDHWCPDKEASILLGPDGVCPACGKRIGS